MKKLIDRRRKYREEIEATPPGLRRTILRALENATGMANAVLLPDLLNAIQKNPMCKKATGRQVRDTIFDMRNEGKLICSLSDVGYFLPLNRHEYNAFVEWYTSYAMRILETKRAMDVTANAELPTEDAQQQPGLFDAAPRKKHLPPTPPRARHDRFDNGLTPDHSSQSSERFASQVGGEVVLRPEENDSMQEDME
jgi:hypothetical protein